MDLLERIQSVWDQAKGLIDEKLPDISYHHTVSQDELNSLLSQNLPKGIKSAALTLHDNGIMLDALAVRPGIQADVQMMLAVEQCRIAHDEQRLVLALKSKPTVSARGAFGKMVLAVLKLFVAVFHRNDLLQWALQGTEGVVADGRLITVDLKHFGGRKVLEDAIREATGRWGDALGLASNIIIASARCKAGQAELECQYLLQCP